MCRNIRKLRQSEKILFAVAFVFATKKSNLFVSIITSAIALPWSLRGFWQKIFWEKILTKDFDQKILTKNIYGNKWIKTCLTDSGLLPYSAMQHLCGTQTDLITTQILQTSDFSLWFFLNPIHWNIIFQIEFLSRRKIMFELLWSWL